MSGEDLSVRLAERERIRREKAASRPEWLRITAQPNEKYTKIKEIMRDRALHTVCEEAHCPNIFECWGKLGTATFMILGDTCTRNCRFCAVKSGLPSEVDHAEPARVADAVAAMNLRYVVVTSVDRDDLNDGGASIFAATIKEIRARIPTCGIEVLIPDFAGNWDALTTVVNALPDILDHNIETVRRLSDSVRSRAKYDRSLELLRKVKEMRPDIRTKSSIMVGLGETMEEIYATMDDLRAMAVDIVTVGQYLHPTKRQVLVEKFYSPAEFREIHVEGMRKGFKHIQAGPLVRTSYHAYDQVLRAEGLPLQSLPEGKKERVWLEHPPTITIGKNGTPEHIIASENKLKEIGMKIYRVDRGGDVTYHGPGQLVVYPVFHLMPWGNDVRKYVRMLEEVVIRTLQTAGIRSKRMDGFPGVWIGNRKICAIGVRARRKTVNLLHHMDWHSMFLSTWATSQPSFLVDFQTRA